MRIDHIEIIVQEHCNDKIFVITELPHPEFKELTLEFIFTTPHGEGVDYCRENFPAIERQVSVI